MTKRAALLTVAIVLVTGQATAETTCMNSPKLVDQCHVTHGRLSVANGTPSLRIWKVGTKRMLGVQTPDGEEDGPNLLPKAVEDRLHPVRGLWGFRVYGDYLVCPLTKERTGWMQMVCIESATRLVTEDLAPDED